MATAVMRRPSALARPRRRAGYHKDVATHLVRLELATRHRGSVLGWLWSLVPPLLQLAATYFLFTKVLPLDIPNYPVFLLSGILAWSWFARSLGGATSSLETRRDLELPPDEPRIGPFGPTTLLGLMESRVLDLWVHEQDIREAIGRPGNLDGPAAAHTVRMLFDALPRLVARRAGVPAGHAVTIDTVLSPTSVSVVPRMI